MKPADCAQNDGTLLLGVGSFGDEGGGVGGFGGCQELGGDGFWRDWFAQLLFTGLIEDGGEVGSGGYGGLRGRGGHGGSGEGGGVGRELLAVVDLRGFGKRGGCGVGCGDGGEDGRRGGWLGCGCGAGLHLEALAAEDGASLRGLEGDGGFDAALRAVGAGFGAGEAGCCWTAGDAGRGGG